MKKPPQPRHCTRSLHGAASEESSRQARLGSQSLEPRLQEDFRSTGRVELSGRAWRVGHPQTSLGLGELLAGKGLGSAAWRFQRLDPNASNLAWG